MKIAIVGSGISGLTAAYMLNPAHDITLYESAPRLGGHTATMPVTVAGERYNIDTGFIVFNDWTYPNFIKLLNRLGVEYQSTNMGFSAFYEDGRFEYSGDNLSTLFADRKTLFSMQHWRMLRDILRFNREAVQDWQSGKLDVRMTLGQYLAKGSYSEAFRSRYLVPMGSAIWSSTLADMADFPVAFFVQFFHNHGLLSVNRRPVWQVIKGGSNQYVEPLTAAYKHRIRLADPVHSISRSAAGVTVRSASGEEQYEQIVLACHSDQALAMLADPSADERDILSGMPYRDNRVVLHTDTRLLPKRRRTWSSWNYCLMDSPEQLPVLTYNMNMLQKIQSDTTFCVTLNANERIRPDAILGEYRYSHPVFSLASLAAQQQWPKINGCNRTWFCGAYWFNGFHEDGVNSALRVTQALGVPNL